MKKGDMVNITSRANYNGQDMRWYETCTGTRTLTSGEVFYHASDKKLTSFFPKTTCFADKKYTEGHYYAIKVINPIVVSEYDDCEVRIDLEKNRTDVEIYYIGTITGKNTGRVHPKGPEYGMERIRKDNTVKI